MTQVLYSGLPKFVADTSEKAEEAFVSALRGLNRSIGSQIFNASVEDLAKHANKSYGSYHTFKITIEDIDGAADEVVA